MLNEMRWVMKKLKMVILGRNTHLTIINKK